MKSQKVPWTIQTDQILRNKESDLSREIWRFLKI